MPAPPSLAQFIRPVGGLRNPTVTHQAEAGEFLGRTAAQEVELLKRVPGLLGDPDGEYAIAKVGGPEGSRDALQALGPTGVADRGAGSTG